MMTLLAALTAHASGASSYISSPDLETTHHRKGKHGARTPEKLQLDSPGNIPSEGTASPRRGPGDARGGARAPDRRENCGLRLSRARLG